MNKNDIWSLNNINEYFDPKFGLVYGDFGNNEFEIILCSTDYDHLSEEDIVIPAHELDLDYSIVVHSDMIFPMHKTDKKLHKKVGSTSENALEQIRLIRNEANESDLSEIRFKVGSPIFYRSDKRYFMKLTNLEFVNYYSEKSFQRLILNIPDNVTPIISFKSESNMLDEMLNVKGRAQTELIARQMLALHDKNIRIEDYSHKADDEEFTTISFDWTKIEKVLVA